VILGAEHHPLRLVAVRQGLGGVVQQGPNLRLLFLDEENYLQLSGSGHTLLASRAEVETQGPHPAPCEPRHPGAACWSQELGPPDQIRHGSVYQVRMKVS